MPEPISLEEITTIDQVTERARGLLDMGKYLWAAAGAGQGVTVARNRVALDHLALQPRMMRDVSRIDTSTVVFGQPVRMPILVAPVGSTQLYAADSAIAAAAGAIKAGTFSFCATLTGARWEDAAATAPGRHMFQLYVMGDRGWLGEIADRVEAAKFAALCVTVDSTVLARRDELVNGKFDWRTEREGLPTNLVPHGRDDAYKYKFTWTELEYLVGRCKIPVLIKGIQHPEDAVRALECGVQGIYVSNHGGRSVDHGLSTIEVLPAVVEAVNGRCDVIVDGGFTRGADVIKALALGARAVAVGRMQCWGLTLGGANGLAHVLQIMRSELENTMALMGCRNVGEITEDCVRWSYPAPPAYHTAPQLDSHASPRVVPLH